MTAQELARALEGRKEGSQWRCRCVVHGGRSLIVRDGEGGKLLVNCKNGCEQADVIAALQAQGLWDESGRKFEGISKEPEAGEVLEREYDYGPAIKGRFRTFSGKTFKWRRKEDTEWKGLRGLKEASLGLYRGAEAASKDGPVFVCEGEKAADACWAVGLLAVCAPGGASAKDFGSAFEILRGRDVVLWPDNDGGGRELGRRLHDLLQPIALTVAYATPELSLRADAFDYFEKGGRAEDIPIDRPRTEPWAEEIADGGLLISVPDSGGYVRFQFADLERVRRDLWAETDTWLDLPGVTRERFTGRLNVSSISGRTEYRRQLDEMFGKLSWTAWLNRACQLVRDAHDNRDPSVVLVEAELVPDDMAWLLPPFVPAEGTVILFGQGGHGKTWLAMGIAVSVSLGIPFLGQAPAQRAVLILDYESSASMLRRRAELIMGGMGMAESLPAIFYWPAQGVALHELAPAIRRKIRDAGVGLFIVDSAVLAAGADPEKADTARRFFADLAGLLVPSLAVAHVTKVDDDKYPFGSIFYHNAPRMTWNVKAVHEEDGGAMSLGLFNRKPWSEGKPCPNIGIKLSFGEAVTFQQDKLNQEFEKEHRLDDRIWALLTKPMTNEALYAALGDAKSDSIRAALRRGRDKDRFVVADDGHWARLDARYE